MCQWIVEQHHIFLGHIGVKRLVKELSRRFVWPGSAEIEKIATAVRARCVICQACDHPNWNTRNAITPTPVPSHVMTSVALDVFSLPRVEWQGNTFDSLLLCVDRLSGWIIAKPTTKLGLTAEKAAHLVMENGWDTFGIPAIITSDQGPQFVGQWWRTM